MKKPKLSKAAQKAIEWYATDIAEHFKSKEPWPLDYTVYAGMLVRSILGFDPAEEMLKLVPEVEMVCDKNRRFMIAKKAKAKPEKKKKAARRASR